MIIDSHAHLNFEDFKDDWQEVIKDCQKDDVWLINVGSQLTSSKKAIKIASQYDQGVYTAIGLHPIHVSGSDFQPEAFNVDNYRDLVKRSKKIVAIGESGLDFFHNPQNIDNQKKAFIKHLDLAKEFDLPIILHSRNSRDGQKNAYREILKILKQEKIDRGVIHCYGGTLEEAKEFLDLGFYIGFTGVVTFPKTEQLAEIVKATPLEKILVETDCPFLTPQPYRGKRNLPQYVKFVAEKVAEIREMDYNKIEKQTFENTTKLFNLD
jgi:TatD DNase family protein